MELTLKKASRVESDIKNRIDEVFKKLEGSVSFSIYADATARRHEARVRANDALALVNRLSEIRFFIRTEIGRKNAAVGISERLSKIAHLQEVQRRLILLSREHAGLTDDELEAEASGRRKNFETGSDRYPSTDFSVEVFSQTDLDSFESALLEVRREMSGANDEVQALNAKTKIQINSDDENLLSEEGLI